MVVTNGNGNGAVIVDGTAPSAVAACAFRWEGHSRTMCCIPTIAKQTHQIYSSLEAKFISSKCYESKSTAQWQAMCIITEIFLLCYLEIAILISVTSDLPLQLFNVIST